MSDETLSDLPYEKRPFSPPAELAASTSVKAEAYVEAGSDRKGDRAAAAGRLSLAKKWYGVLDWGSPPIAKWFRRRAAQRRLQLCRPNVVAGNGARVSIHWVGAPLEGFKGGIASQGSNDGHDADKLPVVRRTGQEGAFRRECPPGRLAQHRSRAAGAAAVALRDQAGRLLAVLAPAAA